MGQLKRKLDILRDREYLLRPVALELIPEITQRIHQDGEASDGTQIGTYSNSYMKLRTGDYKNAEVYKTGKKKGQKKDSGVYTKGSKKGQPREKYNRSSDTKVIVSLTRQLENDWTVVPTDKGYGIGFNNILNVQKLRWVEENKKKIISRLSEKERQYAIDRINELVNAALDS